MRFDSTPFAVLSPYHRAFGEYHRALVVGALGELIRRDEVGGHVVRAWQRGIDPPEVARALDSLYRGEAQVIEMVTRGVPMPDRAAVEWGAWEFEAGAIVSSTACVAAWWYREAVAAAGTGRARTDKEEWLVLGLRRYAALWRVSDESHGTPRGAEPVSSARRSAAALCGPPAPVGTAWR